MSSGIIWKMRKKHRCVVGCTIFLFHSNFYHKICGQFDPADNWLLPIVYSATRSGSKRFRVARFTARGEAECCKRNDESLILPRSSRGSYFPQYANDNKMKLRPLLSTTSGFFHVFHRLFFQGGICHFHFVLHAVEVVFFVHVLRKKRY